MITSTMMSHLAHPVLTATNWNFIFHNTQSVLIKIYIHFLTQWSVKATSFAREERKIDIHFTERPAAGWNIQRRTGLEFRWDVCGPESVRIICVPLELVSDFHWVCQLVNKQEVALVVCIQICRIVISVSREVILNICGGLRVEIYYMLHCCCFLYTERKKSPGRQWSNFSLIWARLSSPLESKYNMT